MSDSQLSLPSEKLKRLRSLANAIPVILKADTKCARGEVFLQTWDAPSRTRRALKWLAMLWGFGAFCIIFPIIHFILPPLLLLLGPVVALQIFRQESAILGGVGSCPGCGERFEIVRSNYLKPKDEWPLTDSCAACRVEVTIEMASRSP